MTLLAAVGLSVGAVAEEGPANEAASRETSTAHRQIEEIILTAQKREQAVEDVPISMSVLDSEFVAEQGLTDINEALLFVPNAKVDVAGFFASPRVRGFSFINNNKVREPGDRVTALIGQFRWQF